MGREKELKLDPQTKRLTGVTLTVREWFAVAACDLDALEDAAGDRIDVVSLEELREILRASHADAHVTLEQLQDPEHPKHGEVMAHLDAWKSRGAGAPRNSSLEAAVAAALKQADPTLFRRGQRAWAWLKRIIGTLGSA